jgi:transposase
MTTALSDRPTLEHWVRSPTTPQRVALRSRIVLFALDGQSADEIARHLGVSARSAKLWVSRFQRQGVAALLHDAPGRGRRSSVDLATFRDRLREANLLDVDGEPVSLRRAASLLGVSASSVWRAMKKGMPLVLRPSE